LTKEKLKENKQKEKKPGVIGKRKASEITKTSKRGKRTEKSKEEEDDQEEEDNEEEEEARRQVKKIKKGKRLISELILRMMDQLFYCCLFKFIKCNVNNKIK